MKIIKRSGTEVVFDIDKIVNAIRAANLEVEESSRLTDRQVVYAAQNVAEACENAGHTVSVEEIQDMVEERLMKRNPSIAKRYIIYREWRNVERDRAAVAALTQMGWTPITIWECELKKDRIDATMERVIEQVRAAESQR